MKAFVIFLLVIGAASLTQASKIPKHEVNKKLIHLLLAKYVEKLETISANLNEFSEKLFVNIANYSVSHGYDPSPLNNISANLIIVDVELTNGQLKGISTLQRYKDVLVSYVHDTKQLTVILPIEFTQIGFTYDYVLHIIGIGPSGIMEGKITDFKFYLELCFDIPNLTFSIKELKTTDSGHISVEWHGHITDMILNILSEFITTILHPLLQGVIEAIIKTVASKIVNDMNEFIYDITHPSNTTLDVSYVPKFSDYVLN